MERLERKEREFHTRRADILEQAEKIFSTKGYHNVTVAEIANASGFAIGSLYQFFDGKEHLESGKPLRLMKMDANEKKALRGYQFLSAKPLLAVVNAADDKLADITKSLDSLNANALGKSMILSPFA